MGAVIASDHVAEPFMQGNATFTHGFTFGGHPIAAAIALANLDVFEREDLCGHVLAKEGEFRAMLESLRDLPIVGDVRGAGYFHAIELVKDKETKETFNDEESEELLRGFLSGELYKRGPDLPRRRPRRPGRPALAAADRRHGAVRGDRRRPPRRPLRGLGADRPSRRSPNGLGATLEPVLTVESLIDELGLELAAGAEAAGSARALGAQHRAAGPDAVAVRRRADADHRASRSTAPPSSASFDRLLADHNLAGLGFGTGFSHKKLPTALVTAARSAASRCSRCPTRCRSSRSPRRRSRSSSTSGTKCCSAASPSSAGSSGWSSRSAAWRKSRRRSPPPSAAPWPILDGRGERLAGRGFRRAALRRRDRRDPQRGARPRRRRPPLRPGHPSVAGRALAHPVISPGGGRPRPGS